MRIYPVDSASLRRSLEKRGGEAFATHTQSYDVADFQQSSYAFGYESLKAFLESGSKTKKVVTIHKVDTLRRELGAAGRRRAETALSWDTVAEQTLAAFRAAVDGRPVASGGV